MSIIMGNLGQSPSTAKNKNNLYYYKFTLCSNNKWYTVKDYKSQVLNLSKGDFVQIYGNIKVPKFGNIQIILKDNDHYINIIAYKFKPNPNITHNIYKDLKK